MFLHEREREVAREAPERPAEDAATPGRATLVEQEALRYLRDAAPGRRGAHMTPAMAAEHRLTGGEIASHAPKRPHHANLAHAHDTTRFVIRSGGIAMAATHDSARHTDHLERPTGEVKLCQALPGEHGAAGAIDVLRPGQYFFVPYENDRTLPSKYVREVAVDGHDKTRTKEREVWVFGFVGKSATEPDRSRAGWLPLHVVMPSPA